MTRAAFISGFKHILKSYDQNGDQRLSRAEVRAMVDSGSSLNHQLTANQAEMRDAALRDYAALDVDRDGYLTLAEILRKPLATFACEDSNGNGSLSVNEILASRDRCGPEGVEKAV